MRITIERLRTSIVILAAVLVGAILLFFAYARYRVRHIGRDLPGKLGIEIQQSTNGFTFSKSDKGHTLFTLHASKAVQYKGGGRALLHDVSITVFGKDNKPSDRISGQEFEYDPAAGTARAMGEVDIEITAPAGNAGQGSGTPVRVKTSGLIFNQKSGMAETSERLEFASSGQGRTLRGSAKGASYNSNTGMMHLHSDVVLNAVLDRGPVALRAQAAEFSRADRLLTLHGATTRANGEDAASDLALVFFRSDGSAERVDARGNVRVNGDGGEALHSRTATVTMDDEGNPERATLGGGVNFAAVQGNRAVDATAATAVLGFGSGAALEHLHLAGGAHAIDRERSAADGAGTAPGSRPGDVVREVNAAQMDATFVPGEAGRPEARTLVADGNAMLTEHQPDAKAPKGGKGTSQGEEVTTLAGDRLLASLGPANALESLHGTGNTQWTHSAGGIQQTSRGDSLEISFAPRGTPRPLTNKPRSKRRVASVGGSTVVNAVQRGHVELVQIAPPANGQNRPVRSTASAEEAVYDGASETMRLQGGTPRLAEQQSELTATTIDFKQTSGDVTAAGAVKATYRQPENAVAAEKANGSAGKPAAGKGAAEPLHIAAGKAYFEHASNQITFSSASPEESRVWQGEASVSAPEIVVSRTKQMLTAHGAGASRPVLAVFPAKADTSKGVARTPAQVARVEGATLVYSAGERKATFTGDVVAREGDAEVRANKAEVFLAPAAVPVAQRGGTLPGLPATSAAGSVERIVTEGDVRITQAGRRGNGERLVYTAADGRFVLTGTASAPPQLTDPEHGTVTGASLIFNNRDGSVMVNGGVAPAITETRVAK